MSAPAAPLPLPLRTRAVAFLVRSLVYGLASIVWLAIVSSSYEALAQFTESALFHPYSWDESWLGRLVFRLIEVCRWLPLGGFALIALMSGRSAVVSALTLLILHCLAFFAMITGVLWLALGLLGVSLS